jgi:hypothetical protein
MAASRAHIRPAATRASAAVSMGAAIPTAAAVVFTVAAPMVEVIDEH